tara:strand:+ start:211 stop:426 length:216 start_codon:yes stop_codon:yes gene_type:complete
MTKGKKVSTDHSFRYGIFVRVVNHVIGTAIMSDNKVTLIANRIDLAKTIKVLVLISHSHMSESAPDTRMIK